jgi:signal transduction histidine kinase
MAIESQLLLHLHELKTRILIGLGWLLSICAAEVSGSSSPVMKEGVLDLREREFTPRSMYNLSGEWEFYWQHFLSPEEYKTGTGPVAPLYVNVPSYWNTYTLDGETLPGRGYGSYALTLLLPSDLEGSVCFEIPPFDVAYTLYVNDEQMGSNGQVGTSLETEEPWHDPERFCFVPDSDTLRIIFHVSNYHNRKGGFWQTMKMGGSEELIAQGDRKRLYQSSTIGVMFFFFFFFLVFWLVSRRDRVMLVFALTCLAIMIRSVNTGLYITNDFVYTPWNWQVRMEFFGTYLGLAMGVWFLHHVFPRKYMNRLVNANFVVSGILILSVFIFPPRIFTYGAIVFQIVFLSYLLHYMAVSFRGMIRRKLVDTIFFLSLGLFMYTVVLDILMVHAVETGRNLYSTQISFQVLILAMSVLIIVQWVRNYNTRVRLESTLRFKNKILSVVAHDLKNPVASIAQFSDLLISRPELSKKQEVINSLKESSQAAIDLLDNLLYWGRSQSEDLKVSPVTFDMTHMVEEVESLFSFMATQKELDFQSHVSPGITVYADRSLINIVIRNLVSNAIKFTPSKGKVEIRIRQAGPEVEIIVADTGVGIKAEILEEFGKEGQLNSTLGTESEVGTGLGLQLVHDLVKRNNGELYIQSKEGEGSVFTFHLPAGETKDEL